MQTSDEGFPIEYRARTSDTRNERKANEFEVVNPPAAQFHSLDGNSQQWKHYEAEEDPENILLYTINNSVLADCSATRKLVGDDEDSEFEIKANNTYQYVLTTSIFEGSDP